MAVSFKAMFVDIARRAYMPWKFLYGSRQMNQEDKYANTQRV